LRVKVKAYATLRDVIGASVEVRLNEGASVRDLLNELSRSCGKSFLERVLDESGGLLPYVKLLVNGRDVDFLNKLETRLKDGDEASLFPPVGGGCSRDRCKPVGQSGKTVGRSRDGLLYDFSNNSPSINGSLLSV